MDEIPSNSWRHNPFRWSLGILASVLLFLILFPAQWVDWGSDWGEHSFCDPASLSGITTHRSDGFASYRPVAAEDVGISLFPPGRMCRLYGVPADYSGRRPMDTGDAVVIAEAAHPEPSSYFLYTLIVLFPLGVNWLVLWAAKRGSA